MNDIILQHAYLISVDKDTTMLQTKSHKDLLLVQAGAGNYSLSAIRLGIPVEILPNASEQELTDKIVELATAESVEETNVFGLAA
jgi:hypothetical protein